MRPFRLGVLVSGSGTNLQAVLDSVHGRDGIAVVCVAANRAEAKALARAQAAGVETGVYPADEYETRAARDEALGEYLAGHEVDLIVLAGFMELLGPAFIERFEGRMINVHPSLLPAFPGVRAIEQSIEYGVRVTGVTVHFVDEGVDSGPIILQRSIDLPYAAAIAEVESRVHEVEHELLPRAIRMIARGLVRLDPSDPRRALIEEPVDAGH